MPDSPRAKRYPALPKSPTASSAKRFAIGFERAYRYNSRLPEYEDIQIDLRAPEWAVSEAQQGYTVGLSGRVQFDNTEMSTAATPLPSGFFEYAVWYLITDRLALRGDPTNDDLQEGDAPKLAGATTVACNTTDG